MTRWRDVRVGWTIKGWEVISVADGEAVLRHPELEVVRAGRPDPDAEAEGAVPPAGHHDAAVALVERELGASVVADGDPKMWRIPRGETHGPNIGAYRYHLRLFHGVYVGDVKTRAGLDDAHETYHLRHLDKHIPHVHEEKT